MPALRALAEVVVAGAVAVLGKLPVAHYLAHGQCGATHGGVVVEPGHSAVVGIGAVVGHLAVVAIAVLVPFRSNQGRHRVGQSIFGLQGGFGQNGDPRCLDFFQLFLIQGEPVSQVRRHVAGVYCSGGGIAQYGQSPCLAAGNYEASSRDVVHIKVFHIGNGNKLQMRILFMGDNGGLFQAVLVHLLLAQGLGSRGDCDHYHCCSQ